MKIGIDARMIKATGIGRYTSNLIKELSKIDSENQYFLFLKKEEFDSFEIPAPNFKKILADFHWYGFTEQLKFPAILKEYNLDLVHFPHFNIPVFYKGKFIVTIHDLTLHRYKTFRSSTKNFLTYQIKHLIYKFIIKKAVEKSLKVIVPSNFTKEGVVKTFRVPKEKIIVTTEGGSSKDFFKKSPDNKILEKLNLKPPFVLYVGNAYPHKNLENLVYSLKYLPSNIDLVLVGKTDEFYERLKNQVLNLRFQDRVIFTDFVTDEELMSLYKNASVYAFPSLNEGFGLPALEAMAFGLPVVSSNFSCLPEILGDAALYFNPQNPREMALKIKEVLENGSLRENLVRKGYNQIRKYSWQKMAQQTFNVYKEVLNND